MEDIAEGRKSGAWLFYKVMQVAPSTHYATRAAPHRLRALGGSTTRADRVHANVRPDLRRRLDTMPWSNTVYVAERAQGHAMVQKARSHVRYRMAYDRLVDMVIGLLRQGWTPEEIAARSPTDFPTDVRMRVGHEALYPWVYSTGQTHRGLWHYFPRGRKKPPEAGPRGPIQR